MIKPGQVNDVNLSSREKEKVNKYDFVLSVSFLETDKILLLLRSMFRQL